MKGFFQWLLKSGMRLARKKRRLEAAGVKDVEQLYEDLSRYIICDGCTAIDARCLGGCRECPVRCCAMERGMVNCAHCPEFGCDRLQGAWKTTVFKDAEPRIKRLRAQQPAGSGGRAG